MPQRTIAIDARFSERVRRLREQRGWLIKELAQRAGIGVRTISRIENLTGTEQCRFVPANLHRIASTLGVELDVLLSGTPDVANSCPIDFSQTSSEQDVTNPARGEVTLNRIPDQPGQMMNEGANIYWVQHDQKYHIPNFDIIHHMQAHQMPGWEVCHRRDRIEHRPGPLLYHKDQASDGILIKVYGEPTVYLIHNAGKCEFHDAYSFENYRYHGEFLDWRDVISVTEEIATREFPDSGRIQLTPQLVAPLSGIELDTSTVSLSWQPHPNRSWRYQLQVADENNPTQVIFEQVLETTSASLADLAPGVYQWRVRGEKTEHPSSDWSETRVFRIKGSPVKGRSPLPQWEL